MTQLSLGTAITKEKEVKQLVTYYKEKGFPFPDLTRAQRLSLCQHLRTYDFRSLISGQVIRHDSYGVEVANYYHKHRYGVRITKGGKCPLDLFKNDLEGVILKCLELNGRVTDNLLLSTLCIYHFAQVAANFPPCTAAAIYRHFLGGTGGVVWDMSMGFGGRLLGAFASGKVWHYYGTDPATESYAGICRMAHDLFCDQPATLFCRGSEEKGLPIPYMGVDLCFTSPPYFNTEQYSYENTQSYIAFPSQGDWLKYFLRPTIENCYSFLHNEGIMAINIANVNTFKDLEEQTIKEAIRAGFVHRSTFAIELPKTPGGNKGRRVQGELNNRKTEPLFVFIKQ